MYRAQLAADCRRPGCMAHETFWCPMQKGQRKQHRQMFLPVKQYGDSTDRAQPFLSVPDMLKCECVGLVSNLLDSLVNLPLQGL